jgi:hypothetical protein
MAMPKVRESGQDVYDVSLDAEEADMLDKHAELWGLSKDDAMADLVDFALAAVVSSKGPEDTRPLFEDGQNYSEIHLSIDYPNTGPLGIFTPADKQFLALWLSTTMREAVTVILYKKMGKERTDGMERQG